MAKLFRVEYFDETTRAWRVHQGRLTFADAKRLVQDMDRTAKGVHGAADAVDTRIVPNDTPTKVGAVDWRAAGLKAAETRRRNLAAKSAASTVQAGPATAADTVTTVVEAVVVSAEHTGAVEVKPEARDLGRQLVARMEWTAGMKDALKAEARTRATALGHEIGEFEGRSYTDAVENGYCEHCLNIVVVNCEPKPGQPQVYGWALNKRCPGKN